MVLGTQRGTKRHRAGPGRTPLLSQRWGACEAALGRQRFSCQLIESLTRQLLPHESLKMVPARANHTMGIEGTGKPLRHAVRK